MVILLTWIRIRIIKHFFNPDPMSKFYPILQFCHGFLYVLAHYSSLFRHYCPLSLYLFPLSYSPCLFNAYIKFSIYIWDRMKTLRVRRRVVMMMTSPHGTAWRLSVVLSEDGAEVEAVGQAPTARRTRRQRSRSRRVGAAAPASRSSSRRRRSEGERKRRSVLPDCTYRAKLFGQMTTSA